MAPFPCGAGNASWDTVAASPFAEEVSVGTWDEVPELFERLKDMPGEYIDKLQVGGAARRHGSTLVRYVLLHLESTALRAECPHALLGRR